MNVEKAIVVGAGLSGATAARLLAESGTRVTIYDERETLGGNVYDYKDKNGIIVQKYGPHIFHTNEKEVFDFLSAFTEWNKYEHKVKALIKKKYVPVPFNMTSLFLLYDETEADAIKKILTEEIGEGKKVSIVELRKNQNPKIKEFAEFVYQNIFYKYTKKQWGLKPDFLHEAINRVPVYISEDDRYFTDDYQFMPKEGFYKMVENILTHPNIQLKTGTNALKELSLANGKVYLSGKEFDGKVIYTGCVDELFNYKYGTLPYRSLYFDFKNKRKTSYLPSAVVNYTTSKKYTRISEFTKFTCPPVKKRTVLVKEYPQKYVRGENLPYYPIPTDKNREIYEKYEKEAEKYPNFYLLGRLATYSYLNMDIAVKKAMELIERIQED